MYFQRLPNYTNSLQLISALIILLLGTTSIALPAPLAACASVVAPNVLHMSNGSTFRKMGEQRQTTGSLGGQN